MSKLPLTKLSEQIEGRDNILILGLGFDQRCLSVLDNFPLSCASAVVGVSNANWQDRNHAAVSAFRVKAGPNAIVIGEHATSILDVADELLKFLQAPLASNCSSIFLDVTAFSHELLSVVTVLLHSFRATDRVTLLYVGANEYSFNTRPEEIWLSHGVKQIRSILGFPGIMRPSRKLHLIMLAGFEVGRAAEIIMQYEPASLSIGLGKKEMSVSAAHHENNRVFFDRLNEFVLKQEAYADCVTHFEFSCLDPAKTKELLLKHIDGIDCPESKNIVICPLNTKLSTVGVALAAIERPEIQLCYAEPLEYNIEGYASPGSEVTFTKISLG